MNHLHRLVMPFPPTADYVVWPFLDYSGKSKAYSTRCKLAHNGMKTHLKTRDAEALPKQSWQDKKMLEHPQSYHPKEGKGMMEAMNHLSGKYFKWCVTEHKRNSGVYTTKWRLQPAYAQKWPQKEGKVRVLLE